MTVTQQHILTELTGQVENITYANEETGYTVARVRVMGRRDLATVVGNLLSPAPGEVLKMEGEWHVHPQFGEQFKVFQYRTQVPVTVQGIKKYLGSGMIRGLGPKMAERIVDHFGEETLEVIESHTERLQAVSGIGEKRIAMIRAAWEEQKEIRDVMLFLQSHGVGAGYATRIFKQYGKKAIAVVKENPFRLATDIHGMGFLTADKIAAKLGFAMNAPSRIEAGLLYVLTQLADEGHVYYPYASLVEKTEAVLDVGRDLVVNALAAAALEKKIVIEDINESLDDYLANQKAVYLPMFHHCETLTAKRIKTLLHVPKSIRAFDSAKALAWIQDQLSITLAEKQLFAVKSALESKVLVITGGPGTGKTTIINAILKIFNRLSVRTLMAAPTGRAAKRMAETTGFEARTIHRMLEFSMANGGFQRHQDNPLACDLLIVDEASMIDTVLMHHLVKALPPTATLILVGDVNQLPSVGAGNVLRDIISSGAVPVVTLNEIFRQARQSRIITNAHRINAGDMPFVDSPSNPETPSDFYFIHQEDPEKVVETIIEMTRNRIPKRFAMDPMQDIQVLTPMYKGAAGATNLNHRLQEALNPAKDAIVRGERRFRIGDKVMQIRNNYEKEVFNGDIGNIGTVDSERQQVIITFDSRQLTYEYGDLDEIVLAYAVSVHKSQGSEYPAVILPVLTQHYILLQRNLIYTAITRGKNLVVLIGTKRALAMAIGNNKPLQRYTYLKERLR